MDFVPKPDLPLVMGDASQLTQVFLNLITNAEQAIREVRNHGTIRIRLGALGDRVLATIPGRWRRHSTGIPCRKSSIPFSPPSVPAAARASASASASPSSANTTARLKLSPCPMAAPYSLYRCRWRKARKYSWPSRPLPARSSSADFGANPLAACSVLVVDDEESIRELVSDGLMARGARVDVAASGEEALCLLDTRGYEVVICDVNLRGVQPDAISGLELYSRLTNGAGFAQRSQKPLFVFMTGELARKRTRRICRRECTRCRNRSAFRI